LVLLNRLVLARLQLFQFLLRFIKFTLTLADFVSIAFLFGFAQVVPTFGNFFLLFGDFFLVIGFELAVAAVRFYFAQRLFQTVNTVLVMMLFCVADLPLDILLFFLARGDGKGAGAQ